MLNDNRSEEICKLLQSELSVAEQWQPTRKGTRHNRQERVTWNKVKAMKNIDVECAHKGHKTLQNDWQDCSSFLWVTNEE